VPEQYRAQHHLFRQAVSFGFHHQHRFLGTSDNQIQIGVFTDAGAGGVEQVLSVLVANTGSSDGAIERQAGDTQGSGSTQQRWNLRIHIRIQRHDSTDNLNFVGVAFGKQRANRTVNQTADQNLFLSRTAFTAEETTGYLTCGVGFLLVVDGHREEVPTFHSTLGTHHGTLNHGTFHVDHNRTVCLTCDFAGLQRYLMIAELKLFLDRGHYSVLNYLSRG